MSPSTVIAKNASGGNNNASNARQTNNDSGNVNGSGRANQQLFRFLPFSKLAAYIDRIRPGLNFVTKVFTMFELLDVLKHIISNNKLYDANNPSMVLCDDALEEALDMKALHLMEIRDQVSKQLVKVDGSPVSALSPPPPAATLNSGPPPPSGGGGARAAAVAAAGRAQSVATVSHQPQPTPSSGHSAKGIPQSQAQPRPQPPSASSNNGSSHLGFITPASRFRVKPGFRRVLALVPGVSDDQSVFTYDELTKHLSHYILSRKESFFDDRNIKVALVGGDPLGEAFRLKAFHRSQVTNLLRNQLIPYEASDSPDSSSPNDRQHPKNGAIGTGTVNQSVASVTPSASCTGVMKTTPPTCVKQEDLGGAIKTEAIIKTEPMTVVKTEPAEVKSEQKALERVSWRSYVASGAARDCVSSTQAPSAPTAHRKLSAPGAPMAPMAPSAAVSSAAVSCGPSTSTQSLSVRTDLFHGSMPEADSFLTVAGGSARPPPSPSPHHGHSLQVMRAEISHQHQINHSVIGQQIVKRRPSNLESSPKSMSSFSVVITRPVKKTRRPSSNGNDDSDDASNDSCDSLDEGNESEETIYSAQGYETVAVCSVLEDDDDEDAEDGEEEYEQNGHSSDDSSDLTDHEQEHLTEYEVDSEADRRIQKEDGNSSAEDSDVQDVMLLATATAAAIMDAGSDEGSFFADSESDSDAEEPLKYYDPEVTPQEHWKCVKCRAPNLPYVGLCHSCFQERKGWVPDRPKPRRKRQRKDKRTNGQPVKRSRQQLERSVSMANDGSKDGATAATSASLSDGEAAAKSTEVMAATASQDEGIASGSSQTLVDTDGEECAAEVAGLEEFGGSLTSGKATANGGSESSSGDDHGSGSQTLMAETNEAKCERGEPSKDCLDKARTVSPVPSTASDASTTATTSTGASAAAASTSSSGCGLAPSSFTVATSRPDLLCNFCLSREKNAGIVHGGIIHQICCYPCAKRLCKRRQPCPLCRRRIEKIAKIIVS